MRSPNLMFRLLLVFALLFVQQGGLAHAVEHAVSEQKQSLPHEKPCELCSAYAQFGSAPTSQPDLQIAQPVVQQSFQSTEFSFVTRTTPIAVARGPPARS